MTKPTTLLSFFDIAVQLMIIQINSEDNSSMFSIFVSSNYLSDIVQHYANIIC